jgi:FO synthase
MWAIVPIKGLAAAKQRLAPMLGPAERQALFRAMIEDVLAALGQVPALDGVAVITADPEAAALAARHGARVLHEDAVRGHSAAVTAAAGALAAEGVASILTLPGDVPLVTADEIGRVLAEHGGAPAVTIVPSRDGQGSNCLACSPPAVLPFGFGEKSFPRHLAAAERHAIAPRVLRLPGLGLDIDTPVDLEALMERPGASRAQAYLRRIGLPSPYRRPDTSEALALAEARDTAALAERAAALRDDGHGALISYSRKVFIPLTRLCRDRCHYCTFAEPPRRDTPAFMTPEQVLEVARAGAALGCKEALFTLGDKPELRYGAARRELEALGHETTISYLAEVAGLVLAETGLLPHLNPGVMTAADLALLKPVSVSQGLMLESAALRLCAKGGPHYGSPDKHPAARLETIGLAGELGIPFTSGILIGIGESRRERVETLLALRELHDRHGHIQEIIVQNFRAKPDTAMARAPEPDLDELVWTIAVARLLLGPEINIQAPPNLSPGALAELIGAGLNDWGGVSPLTPDYVNPEAPWPHLEALAQATAAAGKRLTERLAIYPGYAADGERWLAPELGTAVRHAIDAQGFARTDPWAPGSQHPPPATETPNEAPAMAGRELEQILAKGCAGDDLSETEIGRLFAARGGEFAAVCASADRLRAEVNGDVVSYVVNRNINYTNVCYFRCGFCAFSKGKLSEDLRGPAYDLGLDEIARRVAEAWARGATEVCMQGGIHPNYDGDTYLAICRAVKAAAPGIHLHAFSPLEVWHGAETLGLSLPRFLERLQAAGLDTLPGTAAEVLDDEVRALICPDKISTGQWLEVMAAAHAQGLRSTTTIMYGHVDGPRHWARHLLRLRRQQAQSGGFTEFVPLPFVHMEAPLYLKGRARPGPTWREAVLMHAVARIALHPHIPNIQTSWVKMGPDGAGACLGAGANDLGGTLMNETISRAAGAAHGQEMAPEPMETLIRGLGRTPKQRTTLYGDPPEAQVAASFEAVPLSALEKSAPRRARRGGAARDLARPAAG